MPHTHSDLVKLAGRWLQRRCAVVATEVTHGFTETPDAIGFVPAGAVIVCEAKASRSDFRADRKKWFRRDPLRGMGNMRYYVAPSGLIKPEELNNGWGLLVPHGRGLRVLRDSIVFPEREYRAEQSILISLLRRIGQTSPHGVAIKAYTYDNPCPRATLGIAIEREDHEPGKVEEGGADRHDPEAAEECRGGAHLGLEGS